MIQDIYPSKMHNEFTDHKISDGDVLLQFNSDGKLLLEDRDERVFFPKAVDVKKNCTYLFSLDEIRFFIDLNVIRSRSDEEDASLRDSRYAYYSIREIRDRFSGPEVFAAFTGYHLWRWYSDNIFCGRCGAGLEPDDKERALRCPECGNIIYPRINPAVIVGVIKGDALLITKYKRGYSHNALVAGFTEIGETLEETVAREVMEETGVKVKNIKYYKSQPWGMAQDILVGFFCEADGEAGIRMDESELKYAEWVRRDEIELQPNSLSLTNEMMKVFKEGF